METVSVNSFQRDATQQMQINLVDSHGNPILSNPIDVDELLSSEDHQLAYDGGHGRVIHVQLQEDGEEDEQGYYEDEGQQAWLQEVEDWYDASQPAPKPPIASSMKKTPPASATAEPATPPVPKLAESTKRSKFKDKKSSSDFYEQWKELGAQHQAARPENAPKYRDKLRSAFVGAENGTEKKFSPKPLMHHASVVYAQHGIERVTCFGGTDGHNVEKELYEFQPRQGKWRRLEGKGHSPLGCYGHSLAVRSASPTDIRIYVTGGVGYGGAVIYPHNLPDQASQYRYKLLFPFGSSVTSYHEGGVSALTNKPQSAGGKSHQSITQLIAASGDVARKSTAVGRTGIGLLDCRYEFRVHSSEWCRIVSNADVPLAQHTSIIFDDELITYGGVTDNLRVSDLVHIMDVSQTTSAYSSQAFRPEGLNPTPRFCHVAVSYEGQMIVHGGCNANNDVLDDLWALDASTKQWTSLPLVGQKVSRYGHSAAIVGMKLLLVGGFSALDTEQAVPSRHIYQVNLMPSESGFILQEVACTPTIARMGYGTLQCCNFPDETLVTFGGFGSKRVVKKRNVEEAGIEFQSHKKGHQDKAALSLSQSGYSSPNDSPQTTPRGGNQGAQQNKRLPSKVNNWTHIIAFPHVQQKIEEDSSSEGEKVVKPLTSEMQDFLRRTKQGEDEKYRVICETQHQQTIEAREAAEVKLYFKEDEIEKLLVDVEGTLTHLVQYGADKELPSNVPDRELRLKLIDQNIHGVRRARDVMASMKKPETVQGTGVKMKKKLHRKEGEKFEDFSDAKPFRQVVVLDLLGVAKKAQNELKALNKSLRTFNLWEEKGAFLEFCEEARTNLGDLLKLIASLKKKYIDERTASLMKNAEKKKENLAQLTEIVRRIQHDQIFGKTEQEKRLERRDQKAKAQAQAAKEDKGSKKGDSSRKRSSSAKRKKSHSPVKRAPSQEKPPVVVRFTKDDAEHLSRRSIFAQKNAMELSARFPQQHQTCQQKELQAAQPQMPPSDATIQQGMAPLGMAQQQTAPPPVSVEQLVQEQQPPQQPSNRPMVMDQAPPPLSSSPDAGLSVEQLSEQGKQKTCEYCHVVVKSLKEFDSFIGGEATANSYNVNSCVLKNVRTCRETVTKIESEVAKIRIPKTMEDGRTMLAKDEESKAAAQGLKVSIQSVFQFLKFVFLTKQGIPPTKKRSKVESTAVKPPVPPPQGHPIKRKASPPKTGTASSAQPAVPPNTGPAEVVIALGQQAPMPVQQQPPPIVYMPQSTPQAQNVQLPPWSAQQPPPVFFAPPAQGSRPASQIGPLPQVQAGYSLVSLGQQFLYELPPRPIPPPPQQGVEQAVGNQVATEATKPVTEAPSTQSAPQGGTPVTAGPPPVQAGTPQTETQPTGQATKPVTEAPSTQSAPQGGTPVTAGPPPVQAGTPQTETQPTGQVTTTQSIVATQQGTNIVPQTTTQAVGQQAVPEVTKPATEVQQGTPVSVGPPPLQTGTPPPPQQPTLMAPQAATSAMVVPPAQAATGTKPNESTPGQITTTQNVEPQQQGTIVQPQATPMVGNQAAPNSATEVSKPVTETPSTQSAPQGGTPVTVQTGTPPPQVTQQQPIETITQPIAPKDAPSQEKAEVKVTEQVVNQTPQSQAPTQQTTPSYNFATTAQATYQPGGNTFAAGSLNNQVPTTVVGGGMEVPYGTSFIPSSGGDADYFAMTRYHQGMPITVESSMSGMNRLYMAGQEERIPVPQPRTGVHLGEEDRKPKALFKGKTMTPGEKKILKGRQKNSHW